jgi:hypothetical protein
MAMSADELLVRVAEQATADVGDYADFDNTGDYAVNLERCRHHPLFIWRNPKRRQP